MNLMPARRYLLLVACLALLFPMKNVHAAEQSSMSFDFKETKMKVGDVITAKCVLNTKERIWAVDIKINFDDGKIIIWDSNNNESAATVKASRMLDDVIVNAVDRVNGSIGFIAASDTGKGESPGGLVFTLQMKAREKGIAELEAPGGYVDLYVTDDDENIQKIRIPFTKATIDIED